jgi:hypothetical protein
VTGPVPVEVRVTDCVAVVPTGTVPKLTAVELTASVGVPVSSCRENVCVVLPAEAVNVAVCEAATAATLAEKLALVAPAATVTDEGTVTDGLLLEREIASPPAGAAPDKVAVQASVSAPVRDA